MLTSAKANRWRLSPQAQKCAHPFCTGATEIWRLSPQTCRKRQKGVSFAEAALRIQEVLRVERVGRLPLVLVGEHRRQVGHDDCALERGRGKRCHTYIITQHIYRPPSLSWTFFFYRPVKVLLKQQFHRSPFCVDVFLNAAHGKSLKDAPKIEPDVCHFSLNQLFLTQ